jgi:hypothetical protein
MTAKTRWPLWLSGIAVVLLAGGVLAWGPPEKKDQPAKPNGEEQERKIEEKDVPKAALEALKKLAGGAKLEAFSEEKEHGSTFYEGSWKGPHGKVDGLVTADGAVVEIEEAVTGDNVPKAVMEAAQKAAGKDAELRFEKKTAYYYEVKFKKGDKKTELVLTPDGREQEKEEEQGEEEGDD